jgi:hypothetical protein
MALPAGCGHVQSTSPPLATPIAAVLPKTGKSRQKGCQKTFAKAQKNLKATYKKCQRPLFVFVLFSGIRGMVSQGESKASKS